jgi:lipoprotein-anchoring transpeptidase ErfK/SrfK
MRTMTRFMPRLIAIVAMLSTFLLAAATPLVAHAQGFQGHWVDVDLSNHTATAMNGDSRVYTAYITAGRPGWSTTTGVHYIQRRVYNETMDSSTIGIPNDAPGGYYLTGVYYTQYFYDGEALHYNYWSPSSVFGNVNTSHGCVGMRLGDAAFFWNFADVGTPVVVHW